MISSKTTDIGSRPPYIKRSLPTQIAGLVTCAVLCVSIGAVSGYVTANDIDGWYDTINKPSFNPPNWIFGPVWTTLYVLMAISFWTIWRRHAIKHIVPQSVLFIAQLTLNFFWSIIFFGLHQIGWALLELAFLWLLILATIIAFWKLSRIASVLLWPYLAWVSFAGILNFAFWRLNS